MNVSIHDSASLAVLGIGELSSYLRSKGWVEVRLIRDRAAIWQKQTEEGEDFETLIPQKSSFDDYAQRIGMVLKTLSVVEERSQLEIYSDILRTQMDTVRLQFRSSVFEDGSVPLEQALQMVTGVREMALAAACATISPHAVYANRKPQQAIDYLERVRFGQTERGSFVLSLQTPVPPRLYITQESQKALELAIPELEIAEPFDRRVTLTLARSLDATLNATHRANAKGNLSPFQEAISLGVNANLCDALADLGLNTPTQSIGITFHWSPSRSLLTQTPSSVEFSMDHFTLLREVARLFRETEPVEEYEVVGYVEVLNREEGKFVGTITISDYALGKPRRIRITLSDNDYQRTIEAHKKEAIVQCVGELVKEGRSYVLKNPHSLKISE